MPKSIAKWFQPLQRMQMMEGALDGLIPYTMEMRPEDQHYVPAGFLRSFRPDGEDALFVRRRRGSSWFRQVPENIATRKNFYSVLRDDGTFDDRVEHILARGIERPGLAALWKLNEGEVVPSLYSREAIALFLAVQYTRVPQIRENMHRLLKVVADEFTNEILDEDFLPQRLQETESIDRKTAERTARQLKTLVKAGHIRPVVKEEASMKMLFMAVEDSAYGFMDMDWLVLAADKPCFFTSDIPIYVSPAATTRKYVGIAAEGTVVHAPLSSRRFLLMGRRGGLRIHFAKLREIAPQYFVDELERIPPVVKYRRATPELIETLNEATAISAGDLICGPHESERLAAALLKPRVKSDYHLQRVGGALKIDHRLVLEGPGLDR